MSKGKIGLVGYLGYEVDNPIIGGQMSKTRGIFSELKNKYGESEIIAIDTSNWKNEKIRLALRCLTVAVKCDRILIMPNKNGIKFILPFFAAFKALFRYKLAYPVVGGWLSQFLNQHKLLAKAIKKVDYILPETEALKNELKRFYDGKIEVMPIFSTRKSIDEGSIRCEFTPPYTLCTFSRVTPEKGIDDAVEAVVNANSMAGEVLFQLDVWGPIESGYEKHYQNLFDKNKECARYKGALEGEDCLSTLSQYYMMLFPTFYPGEGFPTSVCEAFMAGLPVIASEWRFNGEIVKEGNTGFLFETRKVTELTELILWAARNKEKIIQMKHSCLAFSKKFEPRNVMKNLEAWLDIGEVQD